ncbi:hypothetical protein [uncultured Jatrophihabitans sp.]|uniref:DUF7341 domain-containing protein n=1 Tax=uncultured Jatrophihabitans sp. TaxID=1610747 RepID=UPI0035CC2D3C
MTDRQSLLIDLSEAINQLTRPRRHTETIEDIVTDIVVSRTGKQRGRRRKIRRQHTTTLPPLLDELRDASRPGSGSDQPGSSGGFESRPSAELEPLSVLREIIDDATRWARTLRVDRSDLPAMLSALVSAPHDDSQLTMLAMQAERWVHRAKQATGHEPLPVTLNQACPICGKRSALVVSGDLDAAKCSRCGARWTTDTIALLTEMLKANEGETMTAQRCYWRHCSRVGVHDEHLDQNTGRTWRDYCDVPQPVGA